MVRHCILTLMTQHKLCIIVLFLEDNTKGVKGGLQTMTELKCKVFEGYYELAEPIKDGDVTIQNLQPVLFVLYSTDLTECVHNKFKFLRLCFGDNGKPAKKFVTCKLNHKKRAKH